MRYLFLSLLTGLLFVSGCSVWDATADYTKETWQTTRDFVDPAPVIDTESYQFDNPNQEKLARLIAPVDGPLTQLTRYVNDTDTQPDIEWLDLLIARFPWVDRVLVTDEAGTIIYMQPELPLKKISQPLVFEGVWRDIQLLTVVDYSELGPELFIARPYYESVDFKGLICVGFDPRSLLRLSPEPAELIVIHPGQRVWSLGADVDEAGLLALPWQDILESEVQGEVQVGDHFYTWLTRYVGEDQYIYATKSVAPGAHGSWWPF